MQIMIIHIIIGQNRNFLIACIIQSLPEKGTVMGQTAITDIFTHADRCFGWIVVTFFQGGKRFAYHNLSRKANIIMDIFFAETDCLLPTDLQGHCLQPLAGNRC